MPIMKDKLVQDFFEAEGVKKLITKKQVDVDPGVHILDEMLQYVRQDIETLDKESKQKLDKKIGELKTINKQRKEYIEKNTEVNDPIDQRNLDRKLLMEDFDLCKKELLFIQNLGYLVGWFD